MVSVPAFFKDRRTVAAIAAVIIIILAIIALTWILTPDLWTSIGLRRDPKLVSYVDALHALVNEQHPQNLTTWRVTWLNNTAVKVTWGYSYYGIVNQTINQTTPSGANATGNVGIPVVNATGNQTRNATANATVNQATPTGKQTMLIRYDESFIMTNFFGTKSASDYVARTNTNYTLVTTNYYRGGAFERAFGKPPSAFANYKQVKGTKGNFIWQFDQFVQVGSCVRSYEGQSSAAPETLIG